MRARARVADTGRTFVGASGEVDGEVEIFTPTGVLAGLTAGCRLSTDGAAPWRRRPRARGRAGSRSTAAAPSSAAESQVAPDDVLVVVATHPEILVHMTWYSVTLDLGPYRVTGELATQPGFDPERALARPGGTFVPLRDARIELVNAAGIGAAERPHVYVNRYAVERVVANLMLGHYFPGATLLTPETVATG